MKTQAQQGQYPVRVEAFNGNQVSLFEIEGRDYLASKDIGVCLGMADPARGVNKVFHRNKEELEPHSLVVNLGLCTTKSIGTPRLFDETGCNLIAMFARTKKSKEFRLWLAKLPRKVRQAQEGWPEVLAESERLGAKRGFLVAAAMLDGKVRPQVYIRIRFCRRAGLTQEETGQVMGLSKHRVKELEKSMRNLGMVFPPVNEMERQKRMKEAFADEIAGGGQRPRPELTGPGHDAPAR